VSSGKPAIAASITTAKVAFKPASHAAHANQLAV
jgi:hypothetical protein